MLSKATRKLTLKKELLRSLDEGHLRAVNGGKGPLSFYAIEFADDTPPQPFSMLGGGI